MVSPIARPGDWLGALFLSLGLSALLTIGFIPIAREAFEWLAAGMHWHASKEWPFELGGRLAFPVLALLFLLSLPRHARPIAETRDTRWVFEISLLPIALSFLFGLLSGAPSIATLLCSPAGRLDLAWYLLLAPLGEEILFRGWLYRVIERAWPVLATATNPLPLAVWMTAFGFSVWHLQNLWEDPAPRVGLQALYTFLTGIWLGFLRWRTGRLSPCVIAHIAVNAATNLL